MVQIIAHPPSAPTPDATDLIVDSPPHAPDGVWRSVMTIEELIRWCVRMQPEEAAVLGDSSLCVTPLITSVIVDGKLVELRLLDGRFGAGYTRVSDEMQRSAYSVIMPSETMLPRTGRRAKRTPDGYSEEEQLNRQIRYFIGQGLAFRIYSDAGITGEYPTNDPLLIKSLLDKKAARFRKIFERTLLDETSLQRRSSDDVRAMRAYLDRQCGRIRQGALSDQEADDSEELGERAKLRLRGRPRSRVYYRQAFTQLWRDIEDDKIHTVAVSDRSRLCRAADLESAFLGLIAAHETRLHGTIEDLSSLDVSNSINKGFAYLIASINEYRLEEIAGHCLRGILQLLESGKPSGRVPWWVERDDDGRAVLIEGRDQIVRKIVSLSLMGLGEGAITRKLRDEGDWADGKALTKTQIHYVITSDALQGYQGFYGLKWKVFPEIIGMETMAEMRELRDQRAEKMSNLHDTRTWASHLFTGLLRCACGNPLIFNHPSKVRRERGDVGYYQCKAHDKDASRGAHACINEDYIEAFFDELLRHHPDVVGKALSAGGDQYQRKMAQRAVIEAELRGARIRHCEREVQAREKASDSVTALGIKADTAAFEAAVESTVAALLECEGREIAELEGQLVQFGLQQREDRQAARAIAAAEELRRWDEFDVLTKNRLLRVLFGEVIVYSLGDRVRPGRGGYITIKLAGVESALPPLMLRRGNRRSVLLPTVGQWIESMLGEGNAPPSPEEEA